MTIASLTILMALQLFTLGARMTDRMVKETAARDLMRELLVTGETGSGRAGSLLWSASISLPKDGLITRQVSVVWADGAGVDTKRLEIADEVVR